MLNELIPTSKITSITTTSKNANFLKFAYISLKVPLKWGEDMSEKAHKFVLMEFPLYTTRFLKFTCIKVRVIYFKIIAQFLYNFLF